MSCSELADDRVARYFAEIAHTWVARYHNAPSFVERLQAVARVTEPLLTGLPSARVLDFAGGPGVISLLCSCKAAFVVNIDRSLEMLAAGAHGRQAVAGLLRGVTDGSPRTVHHVVGDLDVLGPAATGTFDLVLAIAVLEYLDDPGTTVRRLGSLLRAGGAMVATVPRPGSWVRRAERGLRRTSPRFSHLGRTRRVAGIKKYGSLRPFGDYVPWHEGAGVAHLTIEQRVPLAMGTSGMRSRLHPNEIVVLRRGWAEQPGTL